MDKVAFPLLSGMKRTAFCNRHQTVSSLGLAIEQKKRPEKRWGASIRRVLIAFQEMHKSESIDIVDEKTLELINYKISQIPKISIQRNILTSRFFYQIMFGAAVRTIAKNRGWYLNLYF